jgi:hypothetical protein
MMIRHAAFVRAFGLVSDCPLSWLHNRRQRKTYLKCKTRYLSYRTVFDRIATHGLNTVAWPWALPSSPSPSACRLRGFRAGLHRRARQGTALMPCSPESVPYYILFQNELTLSERSNTGFRT